jgi:ABC-2 type transport system permease protein
MIFAVMYREFRIRSTSLTWAFFDLIVPVVYLVLFGIGFDRAFTGGIVIEGTAVAYNHFFLGGVLSMACFGIALNTSYGFFLDRDNGILFEFLTYPMTRGEFLMGKMLFNCLLSIVQALITILVGTLLLHIPLVWDRVHLLVCGIVIGTAGWFFFLSTFALRIRRNDMYNTIINLLYFVLLFASSLFYPLDSMPQWLRWLSLGNPLTWHTDVLRFATVGIGTPGTVLIEAAGYVIFVLLAFRFSVHALQEALLE